MSSQNTDRVPVPQYTFDKNVKTPFFKQLIQVVHTPRNQWSRDLGRCMYHVVVAVSDEYGEKLYPNRLFYQDDVPVSYENMKRVGGDLKSFQPGDKTQPENLMDYVIAFLDKEVEHGSDMNQIDAGEVGTDHECSSKVVTCEKGALQDGSKSACESEVVASSIGNSEARTNRISEHALDLLPIGFQVHEEDVIGDSNDCVITSARYLDADNLSLNDDAFSEYRLSGPNPTSIRLCTKDYLEQLGLERDPEMFELLIRDRLFVVDYSAFAELPAGKHSFLVESIQAQIESRQKFTYGSVAIFKSVESSGERSDVTNNDTNDRTWTFESNLEPVCIQVISHNKMKKVFYPSSTKDVKWKIAKCIFQSNDGLHHEAFAHLTSTHLVIEAFMVATCRCLPRNHPLFALLVKHFEGTAYVNTVFIDDLVSDEGPFSLLFSPSIASIRDMMLESFEEFTSNDMTFPERIRTRGMDKVPSLNYPYRDDGMLLWNAILKWVSEYLQIYYKDDSSLMKDEYVEFWLQELSSSDGGRIKWIKPNEFNRMNARVKLSEVVASIIFIASVEHAAVNYPQRSIMQFTGVYPLSIHAGEEVVFNNNPTEADYMSLYPTIQMARVQALIMRLYGLKRLPRLGHDYHELHDFQTANIEEFTSGQYFIEHVSSEYGDGSGVKRALKEFVEEIARIEEVITERNKRRKYEYVEMLPSQIPSSINF